MRGGRGQLQKIADVFSAVENGLGIFLEDGRIEIDNNLVENAIRPTAIGKKNRLFIGDAAAGERGASIDTVIESFRRRGLVHSKADTVQG